MIRNLMNFIYESIVDNVSEFPLDELCSVNLVNDDKLVIITESNEITIEITDITKR